MALQYNTPPASPSSMGEQFNVQWYQKKALVEAKREQYFSPLASNMDMPKNYGKTISLYHYMPLLDDRNLNDQGIDAQGTTSTTILEAYEIFDAAAQGGKSLGMIPASAAITSPTIAVDEWNKMHNGFGTAVSAALVQNQGALYGGSRDIGSISGKMPSLTETGGNKNRVSFTRIPIKGTINKYGFYDDYTQESLDFDTDPELESHIVTESVKGANEIYEDLLQSDILNAAGVVMYTGDASSIGSTSGDVNAGTGVVPSVPKYEDFVRMDIILNLNRTPKQTKIISGSRMVDTRTINAARIVYVGAEMQPTFERMKDLHGGQAFIPVQKYADGGNTINGEIGAVGLFRIVVVPEMQYHAGGGAVSGGTDDAGTYRSTGGNYDVHPILCVGNESFTTIGFQTDGKGVKFVTKHSKPGSPESYANDKFGETGFFSIKWYYGFMALRPERIAVMWSVVEV